MSKAKVKRIKARLEQIKERAAEMNAASQTKGGVSGSDLAEEAAGLGLEAIELAKEAK